MHRGHRWSRCPPLLPSIEKTVGHHIRRPEITRRDARPYNPREGATWEDQRRYKGKRVNTQTRDILMRWEHIFLKFPRLKILSFLTPFLGSLDQFLGSHFGPIFGVNGAGLIEFPSCSFCYPKKWSVLWFCFGGRGVSFFCFF
jgi:hypothetical protein